MGNPMAKVIDILLSAEQLEGTSATLSRWLVALGSSVNSGEPLIELETDKAALEICSPATGVLLETWVNPGDPVKVGAVVGRLSVQSTIVQPTIVQPSVASIAAPTSVPAASVAATSDSDSVSSTRTDSATRSLISPAVRCLLRQHDLDMGLIAGSGRRGRVTRDDVNNYLAFSPSQPLISTELDAPQRSLLTERQSEPLQGTRIAHTPMRKAIAKHMVSSLLHDSPHVTSVFDMDLSNVIEHRKRHAKEFTEQGVKLTFTAYFVAAAVTALRAVPEVNARFHEDALELFDDINIGIATALGSEGLVVPVLAQLQSLTLLDIARMLNAQTEKARQRSLAPSAMKNGTFSISNYGVSGSLLAVPVIINQPQVAILGVGKLEKRVVVEEVDGIDTMRIKPRCYVSLSIDHRALDGYQANRFLTVFVDRIEHWER